MTRVRYDTPIEIKCRFQFASVGIGWHWHWHMSPKMHSNRLPSVWLPTPNDFLINVRDATETYL